MADRALLFRLTKKDFKIEHIRGSGPGGQHRNKSHTGVRITHPASGASASATDSKSQKTNRKNAFRRLVETNRFKKWHRVECARHMFDKKQVEAKVDRMMAPKNLKVEYFNPV
ncbi:hypothetical protein LCGC14_1952380 [marine sediment metagenome]|uniref:Prokaryotic-type class I peptide chain release factors domain-containing protein n=1 Tax=marine sediment metagenome TaxID=412755 RepID=A0A0F9HVG2_9ZZZZ